MTYKSLIHSVDIGSLHLEGNLFLAPMAGYTDRIYRVLCLENGADLAFTEMVSAEGAARNGDATLDLMERGSGERHLAVQLFMPDGETAERALDNVLKKGPDLIDVNCGCPVPKVVKNGSGSALLREKGRVGEIVRALVSGLSSRGFGGGGEREIPVTVKIRAGWDLNSVNYLSVAEEAFEAGASALCLHARTRSQMYMPVAHWEYLSDLKRRFPEKTIIGSGDLFSAYDALRMLAETGVDAVSFARGAIGNPFIFSQTKKMAEELDSCDFAGNVLAEEKSSHFEAPLIPIERKKEMLLRHLDGLISVLGEHRACREMRKHASAYVKGVSGGGRVRNAVTHALTRADYTDALALL